MAGPPVTSSFGAGGYPTAKPLSKKDYGKKRKGFKNYAAYRNWWSQRPGHESWDPRMGFLNSGGRITDRVGGGGGAGPLVESDRAGGSSGGSVSSNPGGPGQADSLPWQKFLDAMNAQEAAVMERILRTQREAALQRQAGLAGFGQALQGNAAEQWKAITGAYNRAQEEGGAYQGAIADSYSQGLLAQNEQIASDFAQIGQEGPADIRDTGAATEQVRSVGGTDPSSMMGLVGQAWNSYGATRPGTLGFMTEQNIYQSQREAAQAERATTDEFAKAMLDNPREAMEMWSAMEQIQSAKSKDARDAAQQKFENSILRAKEKREAMAFGLDVEEYQTKAGKTLEDIAKQKSETEGWVYRVKNGKVVRTNKRTAQWIKDEATRRETKRHNRSTEDNADRDSRTKERQADIARDKADNQATGKGKSLSQKQAKAYEDDWLDDVAGMAYKLAGVTGRNETPSKRPPKKADMVKAIFAELKGGLLGLSSQWTEKRLIYLINRVINKLPNNWWSKKPSAGTGGGNNSGGSSDRGGGGRFGQ